MLQRLRVIDITSVGIVHVSVDQTFVILPDITYYLNPCRTVTVSPRDNGDFSLRPGGKASQSRIMF